MSVGTKIEWTHRPGTRPATMNALVGCMPVSEGCRNCYAKHVAHVRAGNPLPEIQAKFGGTTKREGGKTLWSGKVTVNEKALLAPLEAKKPHTYFVNSMSDLFFDGVPDEVIDRHFAVFALCPKHTFIVLTKRPERMQAYVTATKAQMSYGPPVVIGRQTALRDQITALASHVDPMRLDRAITAVSGTWTVGSGPLPNVWLGVSVEDQESADERIPLLLQTPAAVRFLSCEPLLGPVNVCAVPDGMARPQEFSAKCTPLGDLDWVIVGGESGRNARPMHPDWARSLRDQCAAAGVPSFFKQWGEWMHGSDFRDSARTVLNDGRVLQGSELEALPQDDRNRWNEFSATMMAPGGKRAAGHLLDGVEHHAFPEVR